MLPHHLLQDKADHYVTIQRLLPRRLRWGLIMPGLNLQGHHTPRHAAMSRAPRFLARRISCVDLAAVCIAVARHLCP
jgi:hypothetical protein